MIDLIILLTIIIVSIAAMFVSSDKSQEMVDNINSAKDHQELEEIVETYPQDTTVDKQMLLDIAHEKAKELK